MWNRFLRRPPRRARPRLQTQTAGPGPRALDARAIVACVRAACALSLLTVLPVFAETATRGVDTTPFCGDEGVWVQILGSGGTELDDGRTPASYAVFLDNQARLVVDPASGSSSLFDQAGGRVNDLDAIVLSNARAERIMDLPAYLMGARAAGRNRLLPILGPDGAAGQPDTATVISRLIGPDGAFPHMADNLPPQAVGRFRASPRNVPASGQRRWSDFAGDHVQLSAVPGFHGGVPALVWKAEIGGKTIVFAGDTNNQRANLAAFAKDADALVIHHSIPEGTRGELAEFHMTPGQIGRVAAEAKARILILGNRTNRTRGRESVTTAAIEEHYKGSLIFADELECWGL